MFSKKKKRELGILENANHFRELSTQNSEITGGAEMVDFKRFYRALVVYAKKPTFDIILSIFNNKKQGRKRKKKG